MKVSEVKQLLPLSDTYELSEELKYLVVVPATAASEHAIRATLQAMMRVGIVAVVCIVRDTEGFRIFDVESLP